MKDRAALAVGALAERRRVLRFIAEELGYGSQPAPLLLDALVSLCPTPLKLSLRPRAGHSNVKVLRIERYIDPAGRSAADHAGTGWP